MAQKFYIFYLTSEGLQMVETDDIPNLEIELTRINEMYLKKEDVLSEPKVFYGNEVKYTTSLICKISG